MLFETSRGNGSDLLHPGPATSTPAAIQAMVERAWTARSNAPTAPKTTTEAAESGAGPPPSGLAGGRDPPGPSRARSRGRRKGGKAILTPGQTVTITTRDVMGQGISHTYEGCPATGARARGPLNDAACADRLRSDARTEGASRGVRSAHRFRTGINLRVRRQKRRPLTEKDVQDALFGRGHGRRHMAAIVRAQRRGRRRLSKVVGDDHLPLIAKIEKTAGRRSHQRDRNGWPMGSWSPRGLGVELPLERAAAGAEGCSSAPPRSKLAIVAKEESSR